MLKDELGECGDGGDGSQAWTLGLLYQRRKSTPRGPTTTRASGTTNAIEGLSSLGWSDRGSILEAAGVGLNEILKGQDHCHR
jgi:hypothetical protein